MASIFATRLAFAGAACTPFRVHTFVHPPTAYQELLPKKLSRNWEKNFADKIGRIKTQSEFPTLYNSWLKNHPFDLTEEERYGWLQCLFYYLKIDTNENGIPDWTAIVDHRPSQILFPNDPDQDGDGIPNVLDLDPLNSTVGKKFASTKIPAHLKIGRAETASLQSELFHKFGIIAIDHTDEHSPIVLKELLSVLENGFPKGFRLKNLRYLYAFAGHDPLRNIASYHREAEALSVAGITSYQELNMTLQEKVDLVAALAHEIGHAILFEKLTAKDLSDASTKFGGWAPSEQTESFFSPFFFQPHFLKRGKNLVSQYSLTNRHEWFAESIAAFVLNKLGQKGLFGDHWQNLISKDESPNSPNYWVEYTNIGNEFSSWLELSTKL